MNRPTTSQSRADELEERLIDFAVRVVSIWLRVIERGQLIKADSLNDIMRENKELCRIFNASLKNNGRKHEGKLINVRLQMTKGGFNYEVQL